MTIADIIAEGVPNEAIDVMFDAKFPSWAKGAAYKRAFIYISPHVFDEVSGGDVDRVGDMTVIFSKTPASEDMIEAHELRPATRRTWAAMILTVMGSSNTVEMVTKNGDTAGILSPDPSKPGKWRFTRFDDRGPVGHIERSDPMEALEDAYSNGFRQISEGAVDRIMGL